MGFDLHKTSRNVRAFLIDAIYPKRCAQCGLRGQWVCGECFASSEVFGEPWCDRCGSPLDRGCRCFMVPDLIEELRSVGPYDGWLRTSVQLIKYQGEFSRVDHLAPFAVSAMRTLGSPGALVPVPLHPQRIRERGFNQSALLAEAMADLSGIEIRDCLIRVRDTPHQVGLTAFERASNVEGAFSIREMPSGMPRSVVLIDDVFTTGATIAACAEVLRQHGARTISALTIC